MVLVPAPPDSTSLYWCWYYLVPVSAGTVLRCGTVAAPLHTLSSVVGADWVRCSSAARLLHVADVLVADVSIKVLYVKSCTMLLIGFLRW